MTVKKLMEFAVVAAMVVGFGIRADAAIYTEKEANVDVVLKALSAKFNATKTDDGKAVVVRNEGVKAICIVDKDKTLVTIRITFSASDKTKRKEMIGLCNRYNDEKVLARFCIDKDTDICIDTFLAYDGGLNTDNLIAQIQWLYSVTSSFMKDYSKEILKEE